MTSGFPQATLVQPLEDKMAMAQAMRSRCMMEAMRFGAAASHWQASLTAATSEGRRRSETSSASVMTPMFRTLALALACVAASFSAACAADALIVENRASDTVWAVYVAPVEVSGWGPNRLATAIPPGDYAEIDVSVFGDRMCMFDILIEDDDGGWAEYTDVNLCESPYVDYYH